MLSLPTLKTGDAVEIIKPASRSTSNRIQALQSVLADMQLRSVVGENLLGADILCANTDAERFESLKSALLNPEIKAVICARGGYGSMRLIPQLRKLHRPSQVKLFIGMSDITALHLFLQQEWGWPVLHGIPASDIFSPESVASCRALMLGEIDVVNFSGVALNQAAQQENVVHASVSGGNLCLVQTSIGTTWQLNAKNKIILLEEVGERGYRVDRMLEHLAQAEILKDAKAIVFGDFVKCEEPDGTSLVPAVLKRFAATMSIPVIQIAGVGHGYMNLPIPLGTPAEIQLGAKINLRVMR